MKEKLIEYDGMTPVEVLSYFRNCYYTAGTVTENGVVANALNEVLPAIEAQRWIPVTERLPENEETVLVLAQRKHWKTEKSIPITSMAFYTDGKHNSEESDYVWNDLTEYIEEADAYVIPEGWWESVQYGEEFFPVDDFVTHWMPLPTPPKDGDT